MGCARASRSFLKLHQSISNCTAAVTLLTSFLVRSFRTRTRSDSGAATEADIDDMNRSDTVHIVKKNTRDNCQRHEVAPYTPSLRSNRLKSQFFWVIRRKKSAKWIPQPTASNWSWTHKEADDYTSGEVRTTMDHGAKCIHDAVVVYNWNKWFYSDNLRSFQSGKVNSSCRCLWRRWCEELLLLLLVSGAATEADTGEELVWYSPRSFSDSSGAVHAQEQPPKLAFITVE